MWETLDLRMVRSTVVAEDHCIIRVLKVMAVVDEGQHIRLYSQGFADFQQVTSVGPHPETNVDSFVGNHLMDIVFDVQVRILDNEFVHPRQVFRK